MEPPRYSGWTCKDTCSSLVPNHFYSRLHVSKCVEIYVACVAGDFLCVIILLVFSGPTCAAFRVILKNNVSNVILALQYLVYQSSGKKTGLPISVSFKWNDPAIHQRKRTAVACMAEAVKCNHRLCCLL